MTILSVPRRLVATGLLVASVLLVGACSDDDEPTPEEANAKICEEKADLAATVQSVRALDANSTTVDGLETVRDNVETAVDELNDAAIVVAENEIEDLRDAKDEFLEAVQGVDDAESLKAAASEIATSAAAVGVAFQALFAAADCA